MRRLLKRTAVPAVLLALLALAACRDAGNSPAPAAPDSASASASGQAAGAPAKPLPTKRTPAEHPSADASMPARPSELHVDRTKMFYSVTGRSARGLLRDLVQRGPRVDSTPHFGRTSWTARWEGEYEQPLKADGNRAGPCQMSRTDVYLEVEITLPRWNTPSDVSATLQRDWNAFIDALAFHEREHRESIISAGRRLMRVLDRMQAPSCAALKDKAHRRAHEIIENARDYNRRYDERTDHGRTQNAVWPPA